MQWTSHIRKGIHYSDQDHLDNLDFADDIALFEEDEMKFQQVMIALDDYNKWRLH